MADRKLDLTTIATTINKVDMSRAKELITNMSSSKSTTSTSKAVVGNDIGDVLKEYCNDKKVNKISKDYLTNLDRLLKMNPGIDLCGSISSKNPIDNILIKNTKGNVKNDFSKIVKQAVTTEMNSIDILGTIPECLYNGILNKISKLSDFGGLSLSKRLDLLSLLKDNCTKDIVNGVVNKTVEQEATKSIIDGLMGVSPSKAYEYITTKSKDSSQTVISALESSLNDKEGIYTAEKLTAYNQLKKDLDNNSITSGTINENILSNLNYQNSDKAYFGDTFSVVSKGIDNMGGIESYSMLKGKTNLAYMASDSLANKVSNDDMYNPIKTTNINLATATVLTNAFI